MGLSTHVLDTMRGRPAEGVAVCLEKADAGGGFAEIARGTTDADGRIGRIADALERAVYRLTFDTGGYFRARGVETFYPSVSITFEVRAPGEHHHVPLLLNPFGYSTYRGS